MILWLIMEIDLTEILVLLWGRFLVVVVWAAEEEGRRRSRLHLVVHLLVAIFLVDVVNGSINSILLRLVFRRVGMSKKVGIGLEIETGLREISLPEVRIGIIVNEISLLEMAIPRVHLWMIVVMRLAHLTEIQTEADRQVHTLHLTGVSVLVVQVQ